MSFRGRSLVGEVFGSWTVLSHDRREQSPTSKYKVYNYWNCRCECGVEKSVNGTSMKEGRSKSCGCTRYEKDNNPNWKGYRDISSSKFTQIRQGAERRRLTLDVSIEDIWEQFIAQNNSCALTGLPLSFDGGSKGTASLDRINSKLGYTKDNVQWVHKDVNKMKNAFDEEWFVTICRLVTEHQSNRVH